MSYELLTNLYFGETTNADLMDAESRARLHVKTPLDDFLVEVVQGGRDVVLTGNPGDGKSHLVRHLADDGWLSGARVELDLSARETAQVLWDWREASEAGRPFVLCANEGPLLGLLDAMAAEPTLRAHHAELRAQLGRLTAARAEELPTEPRHVVLIDLADRNLLDEGIIKNALARVCTQRFFPPLGLSIQAETSAARNLQLLANAPEARARLARLIAAAGRRAGGHFTFRHIWGTIAFALTAAKKAVTLSAEYYGNKVGVDMYPISYLTRAGGRGQGKGALIEAFAAFADPARAADPELDEALWTRGMPARGRWLYPVDHAEAPIERWRAGDELGALEAQRHLKRLVALAHEEGEALVQRVVGEGPTLLERGADDRELLERAFCGLQRLYVSAAAREAAPPWVRDGLPLWVGHSYQDVPGEERPHVAVSAISRGALRVLRPLRAPWLEHALGPPLALAWLEHAASGVALRLDPELLEALALAERSEGPTPLPERVQRFLARLAGWEEGQARAGALTEDHLAVLARPRGALVAAARVARTIHGGAAYDN